MPRVICPFCLTSMNHDFEASLRCPKYGEDVPQKYVKDYQKVPPLWLLTVGFPRHGKTTFLSSLTQTLEHIPQVWSDVHYRALDQHTIKKIREMHVDVKQRRPPEPTPHNQIPRPLLLGMYGLPRLGSRNLVMYDIPGQAYTTLDAIQDVTALKEVRTTWFLISLDDLEKEEEGKTINDLFTAYMSGMEHLRVDLRGRNLIVVYTKADLMKFRTFNPYLHSDPLQGLTRDTGPDLDDLMEETPTFSLDAYVDEMKSISSKLEQFTQKYVRGGAGFINMVKANGMNLVFTITSALGEGTNQQGLLAAQPIPRRVLDPFLWAMYLDNASTGQSLSLIVDPSLLGGPASNVEHLWSELSDQGELSTWVLGRSTPVSQVGQHLPRVVPRGVGPRLIGPILDRTPPGTHVIVLTAGPILDLADFYNSPWRNRLLLVSAGAGSPQEWPNSMSYQSGDTPAVADALLRMKEEAQLP